MNIRQGVIFADLHHRDFDAPTFDAGCDYIRRNRKLIDLIALLGDNQDCGNMSRHNEGKPGLKQKGGVQQDFDAFAHDILDPLDALGEGREGLLKLYFKGNHESWLEQWFEKNPEFEGAFGFEKNLRLHERGWKVIEQGEHYQYGKAYLLHGDEIGSGQNAAKKLVESYCATAVMGHVHTAGMYTKTGIAKKQDKWVGYTLPTAGILAPKYAKGRPNAFVNGIGIIERWPNGYVNVYPVIVIDGQFAFGGQMYGKKTR